MQEHAPPRNFVQRLWYLGVQSTCHIFCVLFFRYRCFGSNRVPASGAVLLLTNHQSHLDPVLMGIACQRRMNYLARKTLFDVPVLGWIIHSVGGISIDRDGPGLAGIKETLRRLRRGEMVLLFPEGRRTDDGEVGPLKPGFCALARRGNVTLLPVGIDGSYDVWPRARLLPRRGRINVWIGQPIGPEEVGQHNDEQLIDLIRRRMKACQMAAREKLGHRPQPKGDSHEKQ